MRRFESCHPSQFSFPLFFRILRVAGSPPWGRFLYKRFRRKRTRTSFAAGRLNLRQLLPRQKNCLSSSELDGQRLALRAEGEKPVHSRESSCAEVAKGAARSRRVGRDNRFGYQGASVYPDQMARVNRRRSDAGLLLESPPLGVWKRDTWMPQDTRLFRKLLNPILSIDGDVRFVRCALRQPPRWRAQRASRPKTRKARPPGTSLHCMCGY